MSKPRPLFIAGFLLFVVALYGAVTLAKGGLYVATYEGDTAHLLDLALRLAGGAQPHTEFMTPLGVLSYAPISFFLNMGAGAGHAFIYSQILVALCLLPALWWAIISRLSGGWAYFFGFYVIVLTLALSQGQTTSAISVAMHYNRWAWSVAYIVVLIAVVAPVYRKSVVADGAIIGVGMAFLALCKLTYFAAFALPVLIALLVRRQWGTLGAAVVAGIGVIAVMTLLMGVDFWGAYLNDLLAVASSDVRPYPNKPFFTMLRLPAYMGGTLLVFLAVVLLRQAGKKDMGLLLMIFAPAFFYVMFQNFGNDPQWLVLTGVLIVLSRPEPGVSNSFGWDMRQALALAAAAIFALSSPAALNMIYSPMVHLKVNEADFGVFLPTRPEHNDLFGDTKRAYALKANIRLDIPDTSPMVKGHGAAKEQTLLAGEPLRACELYDGAVGYFSSIAEELSAAGVGPDDGFLVADIVNVAWMFGDFKPLPGGGPWYYGGAPGLENARYLVVPNCPYRMSERHRIIGEVVKRELPLKEVYRSSMLILMEIGRETPQG
ncbi:DUF2029 domain-containing protein [Actibacterium lipolyticum]|uniref:DUF2029 domain-containing protein n=1 Tax=Actibacterium lipolyticum TaxID=1524263 RepID=A0A238KMX0_9RHOB|nr:DUF2029 domain-containing protein [Actibacterium lipolyticum]SMX44020.1 hypothetical protein COL8621_02442 [Actibacterium lipolyticum]